MHMLFAVFSVSEEESDIILACSISLNNFITSAPERSSARASSAHERRFNKINMLRIEKSFCTNILGIHTFHLIKKKKSIF